MQRIALWVCVSVLALAGCETPNQRTYPGPPPVPILSTRAAPTIEPLPVPPLRPRPRLPAAPVTTEDVRVPGGVKRDKWEVIVVHHSAAEGATPAGMDRYHRDVRHWANGLGYHFVIGNGVNTPDGELYVGPRWKQQLTGAHCASASGRYVGEWCADNHFNEHGIGICLIGNFEKELPTAKQMETLTGLIALLTVEAGISPDDVWGHGEITHKTACPGRKLNMSALRRAVLAAVRKNESMAAWHDAGAPRLGQ